MRLLSCVASDSNVPSQPYFISLVLLAVIELVFDGKLSVLLLQLVCEVASLNDWCLDEAFASLLGWCLNKASVIIT